METLRAVFIDDDERLVEVMSFYLEKHFGGALELVGTASNGVDGLALVKKLVPDVCIVDLALPYMEGLCMLDEIKHDTITDGVMCFMISAFGTDDVLAAAKRAGCDYFFVKPFDVKAVFVKILTIFGEKCRRHGRNSFAENAESAPDQRHYAAGFGMGIEFNEDDVHKEHMPIHDAAQGDRIAALLYSMGISRMNGGFYYLRHCVALCLGDRRYLGGLTKELYPEAAKHFNTNGHRVERSIRNLLCHSWERGAGTQYARAAGLPLHLAAERPATGIFIRQAVEIYDRRYGGNK